MLKRPNFQKFSCWIKKYKGPSIKGYDFSREKYIHAYFIVYKQQQKDSPTKQNNINYIHNQYLQKAFKSV